MEFYTHLTEDLLTEMAEIGRYKGLQIKIYGSEGPIPHFHFEDSKRKGCICLKEAKYFKHGKYQDTLKTKELKDLVEFLKSPHKFFGKYGMTNWQVICVYWGDNNLDYQVDVELPMPNYLELNQQNS